MESLRFQLLPQEVQLVRQWLLATWFIDILTDALLVYGVFFHFGAEFGERLLLRNKLAIDALLTGQGTLRQHLLQPRLTRHILIHAHVMNTSQLQLNEILTVTSHLPIECALNIAQCL